LIDSNYHKLNFAIPRFLIMLTRFSQALLLILASSLLHIAAASPSIAIPAPPVLEKARSLYPELRPALDDRIQGIMQRGNIPGMAIVVIKDGLVLEMKGYGYADRQNQIRVSANTRFGIGSVSKQFTATAVMLLVEDGKLDLDAPISQYLTNLPPTWQPLTLRQLLSHTSGISEDNAWKAQKTKDIIKVGNPKLDFPAGTAWSYSNTGYIIAGLIIEKASGQSYRDFMHDRIFAPLGMTNTQAALTPVPNLAVGVNENGTESSDFRQWQWAGAAGNIISTASDMAKWLQALDARKLLKPNSYQTLWAEAKLNNGRSEPYGLGWGIGKFNGHDIVSHSGAVAGYTSGLIRYPNDRLNVVVLMNSANLTGSTIAGRIASVYDPSISIKSITPQPDPDPAFTKRFLALLQGDKTSLPFAPEFQAVRQTARAKYLDNLTKGDRDIKTLTFLREETQNGDRLLYYKTDWPDKPYAYIGLTAQQQVLGYAAFNLP
jgi:D-alanyl-D-alanine carboxypeptidase